LYKAITDLVTIGELKSTSALGKTQIFEINVMTVAEFQQSTDDPSVPENQKIAEALKGKVTFQPTRKYPRGTFTKDGTGIDPDEFKETFFREFNSRETEAEKRQYLESMLQESGPSAKTEINKLYDIITFGDSFDTSRSDYDSTPWMNSSKKKIIDRPLVTERTDNITKLVNAHMTGLNKDKSKRFNILNTDKAISNLLDVFVPAVLEIESKGDYQAINKEGSGARGGFQFLGKSKKYPRGSAIAALNRLEKYLGKREWGAELRKHGDASLLEPMQQTELFIGDMLEKEGSDKFMQLVFDGDMEGMIQAYEVMHHTNADPKTKARARKIFKTYF